MAEYTQAQLDALRAALHDLMIGKRRERVTFGDRTLVYAKSVDPAAEIRAEIAAAEAYLSDQSNVRRPRSYRAKTSKGL